MKLVRNVCIVVRHGHPFIMKYVVVYSHIRISWRGYIDFFLGVKSTNPIFVISFPNDRLFKDKKLYKVAHVVISNGLFTIKKDLFFDERYLNIRPTTEALNSQLKL